MAFFGATTAFLSLAVGVAFSAEAAFLVGTGFLTAVVFLAGVALSAGSALLAGAALSAGVAFFTFSAFFPDVFLMAFAAFPPPAGVLFAHSGIPTYNHQLSPLGLCSHRGFGHSASLEPGAVIRPGPGRSAPNWPP
ncbi:hypothetical protein GCM10020256_33720 [Streptomyces thermocoprophilus]